MSDEVVGRARSIEEVRAVLRGGAALVWGPPGIGKSTVLSAVAARWPAPTTLVSARGETLPQAVLDALRRAWSLDGEADLARSVAARAGQLIVIDDADGLVGRLSEVTAGLPGATVLFGARPRSGRVAAVELPPLQAEHAARLWLSVARRVQPDGRWPPAAVRELCRRLGGLPLALVLSARRVRTLPPDDPALLAALTRTGPLASMLSEALRSLPADQREALAACAVFEAPFDAAAFEQVTGADGWALESLLDAALLVASGGRVWMPAILREHLHQHSPPGATVRARYAAYVVTAGREANRRWRTTGDPTSLEALRADLVPLAARGDVDAACLLAELHLRRGPLVDPFVEPGGRFDANLLRARILSRQHRQDAALALLDGLPPAPDPAARTLWVRERVHALVSSGRVDEAERHLAELQAPAPSPELAAECAVTEAVLHQRRGRTAAAVSALRGAAAAIDGLDRPELQGRVAAHLGAVLRTADPEGAERAMVRALAAFEALGDHRWQGIVGGWLGVLHHDLGRLERAAELLGQAASHCALAGATSFEAHAHASLAAVRVERAELEGARESLRAAERAGARSPLVEAAVRGTWGLVYLRDGDRARALPHLLAARAGAESLSVWGSAATWAAFAVVADPSTRPGLDEAARRAGDAAVGPWVDALLQGTAGAEAQARSDLRLLALVTRPAGAVVDADGGRVVRRDGVEVDLRHRPILVRILAALATGGPATRDALLAAGWPGQTLVGSSGQARLHVAVSTLRRFGVPIVTTDRDGLAYALEPGTTVRPTG
jgi:tetratricopeptide (TPR) repeat protein